MQIDRTVLVAAGAGLVGLLLGYGVGGPGRAALEAQRAQQDELRTSVAALNEAVGAIDARIGGIEGAVAELGSTQSGRMDGILARIEGLGADVSGAVGGIGSSVSQALSVDLDDLRAKVAAIAARPAGKAEAPAAAAAVAPEGEAIAVGQTVVLGDGAARVFLSAADADGGRARVAINGVATSELALGAPLTVGECRVTLTGLSAKGAVVAADCGSLAPEGSGAGVPMEIGKAEVFGEGAVRVFLSGVDADAGTARVAINGPSTAVLKMSEPVDAGGCTVELTGVADGAATIDVAC